MRVAKSQGKRCTSSSKPDPTRCHTEAAAISARTSYRNIPPLGLRAEVTGLSGAKFLRAAPSKAGLARKSHCPAPKMYFQNPGSKVASFRHQPSALESRPQPGSKDGTSSFRRQRSAPKARPQHRRKSQLFSAEEAHTA